MRFADHRPKVVVLLRDGGQVRRCGSGLELQRPRRLSVTQALGQTVCAPGHDSSFSPINLRIVGKPGIVGLKPVNEQLDRNGMALHPSESLPV